MQAIIAAAGPESASDFTWRQYLRNPADLYWQKILARHVGPQIKERALLSTGHPLIDHSLGLILSLVNALSKEARTAIWAILGQEVWTFDTLPPQWAEVQKQMRSACEQIEDENSEPSAPGALRTWNHATRKWVYYYYPPNERNRVALVYLFGTYARAVREGVARAEAEAAVELDVRARARPRGIFPPFYPHTFTDMDEEEKALREMHLDAARCPKAPPLPEPLRSLSALFCITHTAAAFKRATEAREAEAGARKHRHEMWVNDRFNASLAQIRTSLK